MDIPASVSLATVTGNILQAVLDGPDAGLIPELREVPGLRAIVTATVPWIPYTHEGENRLLAMPPFVFRTNQVGEIVNGEHADAGVQVPATTGNGPEFQYNVEVVWDGQDKPLIWRASAPPDGVLDVSSPVNVPPPEEVPGWYQAMAEVAAARTEILAAHVDVMQAAEDVTALTAGQVFDDAIVSPSWGWSSQKISAELATPNAHTHSAADITSGVVSAARLPAASQYAAGITRHATVAEAVDGAGAAAVTPAGLHAAVGPLVRDEFGDVLDLAWLWEAGTQQVLGTPTYDGSGEATHPSVLYFEGGWNGWKYWMGMTPYPGGNEAHEDPSILVSNDGVSWSVPSGLTNPLDNQTGAPNPHNSDTNLVMRGGTMYLLWRMVDRPNGNATRLFWRTSTNGTTWTEKQEIFAPAAGLLAPSLVWTGTRWELFGMEGSTFVRWHTTVVSPTTSTSWTRTALSVPRPPQVYRWWHVEVKFQAGMYMAVFNGYDTLGAARGGDLYLGFSADGQTWRVADVPLLPAAPAGQSRYQGSIVVKSGAGVGMVMELFFGRIDWAGAGQTWRISRAPVTAPTTIGAVAKRARVPETERPWEPMNVDASLDLSGLKTTVEGKKVRVKGTIVRSDGEAVPSGLRAFSLPVTALRPPVEMRFPVAYGTAVSQLRVGPADDPLWVKLYAHDLGNIAASVTFYVDIEWDV